jgi:RNA-directed DNA polymerase
MLRAPQAALPATAQPAPKPLPPSAPSAAKVAEKIDVPTPAPPALLKPHQRRLALHDERLLAKTASLTHTVTARRRQKKYFTADEARRLFSATLRTRNRNLRDLTTDEGQLARYSLPVWHTEAELAGALAVDLKALRHFSTHSAKDRLTHYVTFAIPKRTGGERLIMAPKARLKALQRRLNALLVSKLPVSEYAHGFRTGHSVRSNAEPHVGKSVILRLDIKDFFPSIHFERVRGLLISLGYGFPVAATLAALMTEAPRQPVLVGDAVFFPPAGPRACPQGAPTSPGLSNALLVKMDRRLAGLARRRGFVYTRYADDLTFSGQDIAGAHALRLSAARVVKEEGFAINQHKTRVMRSGSSQTVAGVGVNDVLGLSRQVRRRLRAAIHQFAKTHAAGHGDPALLARLDGKVAYVSMLNVEQARRLAPR